MTAQLDKPTLRTHLDDRRRSPWPLAAGRNVITSTFSTIVHKRVYTLEASRASEAEPRYHNLMANALRLGILTDHR